MTPPLLVLGDLMLDRYTWGDAERVSPEAPVLVLQAETDEVRLGGAASVAGLLAGLGARPLVAGVVGDDPEGRIIQRLLAEQQSRSGIRENSDIPRSGTRKSSGGPRSGIRENSDGPGSGIRENSDASPPQSETHHLVLTDPSRSTTHKQRFLGGDTGMKRRYGDAMLGRAAHHRAHQVLRVDRESREPLEPRLAAKLAVAAVAALPVCQAVLISDYAKGVCTPRLLAEVIAAARGRRLPVLVDPARGADYERYRGASLIKPNRDEASAAVGRPIGSPDEAIAVGRELCRRFGIAAAVITLDVDGLVLVDVGGQVSNEAGGEVASGTNGEGWRGSSGAGWRGQHFAAQSRAVCDVTGAGDTVLAVLGLAAASHIDMAIACEQAVVAAGLQVERLGVAPIAWDEIQIECSGIRKNSESPRSGTRKNSGDSRSGIRENSGAARSGTRKSSSASRSGTRKSSGVPRSGIRENSDALDQSPITDGQSQITGDQGQIANDQSQLPNSKITSLDALVPLVSRHIAGGRRVVFTNGCFDLLHLGHLNLLAQAKQAGDVLIVAINGDAGVERLKGPGRPIMRAADRAALIAALECVDRVVIFDDDTPERLIMSLRPDVLVKGADYEPGDVVGRGFVESYGGRVLLADFVPGHSTTGIVERMEALASGEPTPGYPRSGSAGAPCPGVSPPVLALGVRQ